MRELKYHEKKLLKKVNLVEWKTTNTKREQMIVSKYLLHSRDEYVVYNRVVGMIRKLVESLSRLPSNDPLRLYISKKVIKKLYDIGLIEGNSNKLSSCLSITVSSFCKRRLPMVLTYKKMSPNFQDADKFVQHGHIKVGVSICKESSILITRSMEDFVTWADHSKIKKKIDEYNNEYDDYNY